MSVFQYLKEELFKSEEEVIKQLIEDFNLDEGLMDSIRKSYKFLPIFALLFQLLISSPTATPVKKDDIRIALTSMQDSKSKDELDSTSKDVVGLISTLKGDQRNKFIEIFKKAYKEVENKINS